MTIVCCFAIYKISFTILKMFVNLESQISPSHDLHKISLLVSSQSHVECHAGILSAFSQTSSALSCLSSPVSILTTSLSAILWVKNYAKEFLLRLACLLCSLSEIFSTHVLVGLPQPMTFKKINKNFCNEQENRARLSRGYEERNVVSDAKMRGPKTT